MQEENKKKSSYILNFIKFFIVSWFMINFLNFLNFKFFLAVLHIRFPFLPLFSSIFFAILLALFLTYYSFQIKKILDVKKEDKIFNFNSSIKLFQTELTLFEKIMYLFLNLSLFLFLTTLSAAVSIYINKLLGAETSIFIYLLLVFLVIKLLIKVFKSQKFRVYKMGIKA